MIYKFTGRGAASRAFDLAERIYPIVFDMTDRYRECARQVVHTWCEDQFGPPAYDGTNPLHRVDQACVIALDCRWVRLDDEFRFRDPTYATVFRLRWC